MEVTCGLDVPSDIKGSCVWGSVDPRDGSLHAYAADTCERLDEAVANNAFPVRVDAFAATIYDHGDGRYTQRTSGGFRTVFCERVAEGQTRVTKTVFHMHARQAWYVRTPKVTHVGFVVDTSGSMHAMYKDVVEQGVEQFLQRQAALAHPVMLYGLTFNASVNVVFDGAPLAQDMDGVRDAFYAVKPTGGTAYFDAMCAAIRMIDKRAYPGDEVVICCMTDGCDNSSRATADTVRQLLDVRKKDGWIVTLLGTPEANVPQLCTDVGIDAGAGMTMGLTRAQNERAYQAVAAGMARVRSGADTQLRFTGAERTASC